MKSSSAIAVYLFELLRLDVALAGDLLEERKRGRSAIWFWKQVLAALWSGMWRPVYDHWVLALRAVAMGLAFEAALGFAWNRWVPDMTPFTTLHWTVQIGTVLITQLAIGWFLARTHRAHPIPTVALFLLVFCSAYAARCFPLLKLAWDPSIDQAQLRPYLWMFFVTLLGTIIGQLLGAVFGTRRQSQSDPQAEPRP